LDRCLYCRDLYSDILKVFDDVQAVHVALGSHVFTLALTGLSLFDNYLPSRDDIKKWVAEQEEKQNEKENEDV
jgi:hypothetical protein